jgi:hypothetical protein
MGSAAGSPHARHFLFLGVLGANDPEIQLRCLFPGGSLA